MQLYKKFVGVGLGIALSLVSVNTVALAASVPVPAPDSEVRNENLAIEPVNLSFEKENRTDGFYYWRVTSKSVVGYPYGSWRNGPSGRGPATVSLTNSSTYSRSVTNTISGSYTNKAAIAASLGVTIDKSNTYSVSYSLNVPRGKKYQIRYRPQFKKYKVVQTQYYKIDGKAHKTGTKISYVKVFSNWDYSWRAVR